MVYRTSKICNAPHPDNVIITSTERFCDRAKGHKDSHWTTIEGVKYFWS
jgi:hypothetical protein